MHRWISPLTVGDSCCDRVGRLVNIEVLSAKPPRILTDDAAQVHKVVTCWLITCLVAPAVAKSGLETGEHTTSSAIGWARDAGSSGHLEHPCNHWG